MVNNGNRPQGGGGFAKVVRTEQEVFSELEKLCASPGFIHAIAFICFRDNVIAYQGELKPDDFDHMYSGSQLIRTEISTLIGLVTKTEIDFQFPGENKVADYVAHAEALLNELHQALSAVWFRGFDLNAIQAGFDPFSTAEALREPIFYGGESAYNFQYRDLAKQRYLADHEWLLANNGFDIGEAITVALELSHLITEKQTELFYQGKGGAPPRSFFPAFCFSVEEVVARTKLGADKIRAVIGAFCVQVGEKNTRFTTLQEFNVTNAAPILLLPGEKFVLLQPYSLLESMYESPFYWMQSDRVYASVSNEHRGKFTEAFALSRLRAVFGKNVLANVRLKRGGRDIGEIDVLVIFADRAIVLQAKSKRLTLAARKGNDAQLKDDFKKSIQDACDQAMGCAKELLAGDCRLIDVNGSVIEPVVPIKQIFPICIVADHYPALAFQARQFLKSASLSGVEPPLVTDVFALDAMTEMLESPLQLLSYLRLRAMHGAKVIYNHELTLLSLHLRRNLWIGSEYDMVSFDDGIGVYLDVAMAVRREGAPGRRTPDGILTRLLGTRVGRVLAEIDADPNSATIDLGFYLLSLNEDTTDAINLGIEKIISQFAEDGCEHDFGVATGGDSGLTVHCNARPQDEAIKHLLVHCQLRKYSMKASKWFGLAIDPKTGDLRFGVILDALWEQDDLMDAAMHHMGPITPPKKIIRQLRKTKKGGRNQPCNCGSGRKYKNCCGRN